MPNFSVHNNDYHDMPDQDQRDIEREINITDLALNILNSGMSQTKAAVILDLPRSTLRTYIERRSRRDHKYCCEMASIKQRNRKMKKEIRAEKARLRAKIYREQRKAFMLVDEDYFFRIRKKPFRKLRISDYAYKRWTMTRKNEKVNSL